MSHANSMTEAPIQNGQHDPRVAVAKRIVTRLAYFVIFTLVVSGTFAVIHLATDRPVKEVLGFGKSDE